MPLSSSEFLARVRQKYPDDYGELQDDELSDIILEKHPVYAPILRPPISSDDEDTDTFTPEEGEGFSPPKKKKYPREGVLPTDFGAEFAQEIGDRARGILPNPMEAAQGGAQIGEEAMRGLGVTGESTMGQITTAGAAGIAGVGNVIGDLARPVMAAARYPFVATAAAAKYAGGDTEGAIEKLANPEAPVVETQTTNVQPFGEHHNLNALVDVFGDTFKSVFQENPELAVLAITGKANEAAKARGQLAELARERQTTLPEAPVVESPIPTTELLPTQGPQEISGKITLGKHNDTFPDLYRKIVMDQIESGKPMILEGKGDIEFARSIDPNFRILEHANGTGEIIAAEDPLTGRMVSQNPLQDKAASTPPVEIPTATEITPRAEPEISPLEEGYRKHDALQKQISDMEDDLILQGKDFQGSPTELKDLYAQRDALREQLKNPQQFTKVADLSDQHISTLADNLDLPERTIADAATHTADILKEIAPEETMSAAVPMGEEAGYSMGPGAASSKEVLQHQSQITQLNDIIKNISREKGSIHERMDAAHAIVEKARNIKDSFTQGLTNVKATAEVFKNALTKLPQYTEFRRALGNWQFELFKSNHEISKFGRGIRSSIPDKLRREAITNYIQADGDAGLLQKRAESSSGSLKRGYELATQLTDKEKNMAENIKQYFDAQLQAGIDSGILKHGLDNYVNQMWKHGNPITDALLGETTLQPNFKFARQRIFDSFFDGEQKGHVPKTKDIGALVAAYDQSFNRSLAARGFIKQLLTDGKASDGRPLAVLTGSIDKPVEGESTARFVRAQSRPENTTDYKYVDHPALAGWKYLEKSPDGKNMFLRGDALIHPEVYKHLRNVLGKSMLRDNKITSGLLNLQSTAKQTQLSLSTFHLLTEAEHALGHKVNPFKLPEFDPTNPIHKDLVSHGLQMGDKNALNDFSEGLTGGGLLNRLPGVGTKILQPFNEWLFTEYIPRLKLSMAMDALERNTKRYSDKVDRDQILELTSRQANAAFGELNYKYMGRNPTLQDTLRLTLLAPDFLEARGRFAAQALTGHGAEQRMALLLLGVTNYVGARIMNKIVDDDYHWEKPFSVVYHGKEYGLRTVPGDLLHMMTEPRKFWYGRLSPIYGRGAVEFLSGKDYRGAPVNGEEQIKDVLKSYIPMNLVRAKDKDLLDTIISSVGLVVKPSTEGNQIYELAKQFNQKTGYKDADEQVFMQSKYAELKNALRLKDDDKARQALDNLRATTNGSTLVKGLKRSFDVKMPFTGSKQQEKLFFQSLDDRQKQRYRAALAERAQLRAQLSHILSSSPTVQEP